MTGVSLRPGRRGLSRGLWALSVLFLAGAVALATVQPAQATTNGSDWGPNGVTTSNSAVTVNWNNADNPASSLVPRDNSQTLPYTGGKKTYNDVSSSIRNGVQSAFGSMKLTVSQTTGLQHQGVTVSFTGVTGGKGGINQSDSTYLDVFQCWGGAAVDGVAETNDPDPVDCQQGAGGIDAVQRLGRSIAPADSKLLSAGDLKAETTIALTGEQIGTTATLTATVKALTVPNGLELADGAVGTVEFDRADGTVVAKAVPLVNGVATTNATGLTVGQASDFIASYIAAPAENYSNSPTSQDLSLPRRLITGSSNNSTTPRTPGSNNTITFPAGTFAAGDPVTVALNFGAATPVGTADAFGGLTLDYTIPTALTAGSDNVARFLGSIPPTDTNNVEFVIAGAPAAPADPGSGDNVPNVSGSFPFVSVGGVVGGNAFFNKTTTNEFTDFEASPTPAAAASRTFELQTGAEAPGLGCGFRGDQPSTNTCWLVAVPRGYSGDPGFSISPLSPSLWAQRVQVKLNFQDVAQTCAGGQARTLAAGSELLGAAIASWVPAMCTDKKIALGYSSVGDPQARQQYSAGDQNLIFTSQPADDSGGGTTTLSAPVGLTGVTIGYHFSNSRTGQAVTGLKLNARLVAKLLTESYYEGTDNPEANGSQLGVKAPWAVLGIHSLSEDPEFQALNPELPTNGDLSDHGDLVVDSTLSDAVTLLWQWIVGDPDAKAFLDGCPDAASNDSVINPFYSTRSYAECLPQKTTLEATALAERSPLSAANPNGTDLSPDYTDAPVAYPPTGAAFPQPGWYQRDSQGTGGSQTLPLSLANIHARESTLALVGLDVFHGLEPANTAWCFAANDSSCTSGPGTTGKWTQGLPASLINTVFGVSDAPVEAQYQVATAQLCDDGGDCVGADTASLQKAATEFQPGTDPDAPQPSTTQDEKGGAYPLTLPVYAQVNSIGLLAADAATIATVLEFMTTTGQTPGFASGNLPPGYAPLTTSMVGQASKTIAVLRSIIDPVVGDSEQQQPPPEQQQTVTPDAIMVPTTTTTTTTGGQKTPVVAAAVGMTPTTEVGFIPQFGLLTGLGGAIVAGVAAPLVGRKRRVLPQ